MVNDYDDGPWPDDWNDFGDWQPPAEPESQPTWEPEPYDFEQAAYDRAASRGEIAGRDDRGDDGAPLDEGLTAVDEAVSTSLDEGIEAGGDYETPGFAPDLPEAEPAPSPTSYYSDQPLEDLSPTDEEYIAGIPEPEAPPPEPPTSLRDALAGIDDAQAEEVRQALKDQLAAQATQVQLPDGTFEEAEAYYSRLVDRLTTQAQRQAAEGVEQESARRRQEAEVILYGREEDRVDGLGGWTKDRQDAVQAARDQALMDLRQKYPDRPDELYEKALPTVDELVAQQEAERPLPTVDELVSMMYPDEPSVADFMPKVPGLASLLAPHNLDEEQLAARLDQVLDLPLDRFGELGVALTAQQAELRSQQALQAMLPKYERLANAMAERDYVGWGVSPDLAVRIRELGFEPAEVVRAHQLTQPGSPLRDYVELIEQNILLSDVQKATAERQRVQGRVQAALRQRQLEDPAAYRDMLADMERANIERATREVVGGTASAVGNVLTFPVQKGWEALTAIWQTAEIVSKMTTGGMLAERRSLNPLENPWSVALGTSPAELWRRGPNPYVEAGLTATEGALLGGLLGTSLLAIPPDLQHALRTGAAMGTRAREELLGQLEKIPGLGIPAQVLLAPGTWMATGGLTGIGLDLFGAPAIGAEALKAAQVDLHELAAKHGVDLATTNVATLMAFNVAFREELNDLWRKHENPWAEAIMGLAVDPTTYFGLFGLGGVVARRMPAGLSQAASIAKALRLNLDEVAMGAVPRLGENIDVTHRLPRLTEALTAPALGVRAGAKQIAAAAGEAIGEPAKMLAMLWETVPARVRHEADLIGGQLGALVARNGDDIDTVVSRLRAFAAGDDTQLQALFGSSGVGSPALSYSGRLARQFLDRLGGSDGLVNTLGNKIAGAIDPHSAEYLNMSSSQRALWVAHSDPKVRDQMLQTAVRHTIMRYVEEKMGDIYKPMLDRPLTHLGVSLDAVTGGITRFWSQLFLSNPAFAMLNFTSNMYFGWLDGTVTLQPRLGGESARDYLKRMGMPLAEDFGRRAGAKAQGFATLDASMSGPGFWSFIAKGHEKTTGWIPGLGKNWQAASGSVEAVFRDGARAKVAQAMEAEMRRFAEDGGIIPRMDAVIADLRAARPDLRGEELEALERSVRGLASDLSGRKLNAAWKALNEAIAAGGTITIHVPPTAAALVPPPASFHGSMAIPDAIARATDPGAVYEGAINGALRDLNAQRAQIGLPPVERAPGGGSLGLDGWHDLADELGARGLPNAVEEVGQRLAAHAVREAHEAMRVQGLRVARPAVPPSLEGTLAGIDADYRNKLTVMLSRWGTPTGAVGSWKPATLLRNMDKLRVARDNQWDRAIASVDNLRHDGLEAQLVAKLQGHGVVEGRTTRLGVGLPTPEGVGDIGLPTLRGTGIYRGLGGIVDPRALEKQLGDAFGQVMAARQSLPFTRPELAATEPVAKTLDVIYQRVGELRDEVELLIGMRHPKDVEALAKMFPEGGPVDIASSELALPGRGIDVVETVPYKPATPARIREVEQHIKELDAQIRVAMGELQRATREFPATSWALLKQLAAERARLGLPTHRPLPSDVARRVVAEFTSPTPPATPTLLTGLHAAQGRLAAVHDDALRTAIQQPASAASLEALRKAHPDAVYVGRDTDWAHSVYGAAWTPEMATQSAKWGNPYVVGPNRTREQAVALYQQRLVDEPWRIMEAQDELAGKVLIYVFGRDNPVQGSHAELLYRVAHTPLPDSFRAAYTRWKSRLAAPARKSPTGLPFAREQQLGIQNAQVALREEARKLFDETPVVSPAAPLFTHVDEIQKLRADLVALVRTGGQALDSPAVVAGTSKLYNMVGGALKRPDLAPELRKELVALQARLKKDVLDPAAGKLREASQQRVPLRRYPAAQPTAPGAAMRKPGAPPQSFTGKRPNDVPYQEPEIGGYAAQELASDEAIAAMRADNAQAALRQAEAHLANLERTGTAEAVQAARLERDSLKLAADKAHLDARAAAMLRKGPRAAEDIVAARDTTKGMRLRYVQIMKDLGQGHVAKVVEDNMSELAFFLRKLGKPPVVVVHASPKWAVPTGMMQQGDQLDIINRAVDLLPPGTVAYTRAGEGGDAAVRARLQERGITFGELHSPTAPFSPERATAARDATLRDNAMLEAARQQAEREGRQVIQIGFQSFQANAGQNVPELAVHRLLTRGRNEGMPQWIFYNVPTGTYKRPPTAPELEKAKALAPDMAADLKGRLEDLEERLKDIVEDLVAARAITGPQDEQIGLLVAERAAVIREHTELSATLRGLPKRDPTEGLGRRPRPTSDNPRLKAIRESIQALGQEQSAISKRGKVEGAALEEWKRLGQEIEKLLAEQRSIRPPQGGTILTMGVDPRAVWRALQGVFSPQEDPGVSLAVAQLAGLEITPEVLRRRWAAGMNPRAVENTPVTWAELERYQAEAAAGGSISRGVGQPSYPEWLDLALGVRRPAPPRQRPSGNIMGEVTDFGPGVMPPGMTGIVDLYHTNAYWRQVNDARLATPTNQPLRAARIPELGVQTELPGTTARALSAWMGEVSKMQDVARLKMRTVGEAAADWTLHNYDRLYGFDRLLRLLNPWEFWSTRTMSKWGGRMIENPRKIALINRLRERQADIGEYLTVATSDQPYDWHEAKEQVAKQRSEGPEWVRQYMKIPLPFAPQDDPFLKDAGLFVDPLGRMSSSPWWVDAFVDNDVKAMWNRLLGDEQAAGSLSGESGLGRGVMQATGGLYGPSAMFLLGITGLLGEKRQSVGGALSKTTTAEDQWRLGSIIFREPLNHMLKTFGVQIPKEGLSSPLSGFGLFPQLRPFVDDQLKTMTARNLAIGIENGRWTLADVTDALAGQNEALLDKATGYALVELGVRRMGSTMGLGPFYLDLLEVDARRKEMENLHDLYRSGTNEEIQAFYEDRRSGGQPFVSARVREMIKGKDVDGLREIARREVTWGLSRDLDEKYAQIKGGLAFSGYDTWMSLDALTAAKRTELDAILVSQGYVDADGKASREAFYGDPVQRQRDRQVRVVEAFIKGQADKQTTPERLQEILKDLGVQSEAIPVAMAKREYFAIPDQFKYEVAPGEFVIDWGAARAAQQAYMLSPRFGVSALTLEDQVRNNSLSPVELLNQAWQDVYLDARYKAAEGITDGARRQAAYDTVKLPTAEQLVEAAHARQREVEGKPLFTPEELRDALLSVPDAQAWYDAGYDKDRRGLLERGEPFIWGRTGEPVVTPEQMALLDQATKEREVRLRDTEIYYRTSQTEGVDRRASDREAVGSGNTPYWSDKSTPRRDTGLPAAAKPRGAAPTASDNELRWYPKAGEADRQKDQRAHQRQMAIEATLADWVPNPWQNYGGPPPPDIVPTAAPPPATTGGLSVVAPPPPDIPVLDPNELFAGLRGGRRGLSGDTPSGLPEPPAPAAPPARGGGTGTSPGPRQGTYYDNETGILYGGTDERLSRAQDAVFKLDARELGERYDETRVALLDKLGVTNQELIDYGKRNHQPHEALKEKLRELVIDPGNRAYALVKDDPKLVKEVLKATIDANTLVEAVVNDPVYASRGITREMLEPLVELYGVPTLKDYWNRNDPPEIRAIEDQVDLLYEKLDTLFDTAKKTQGRAARDKLVEEIKTVRTKIDQLQGEKKALEKQNLVQTALYDGTPGLLQEILQGKRTPAGKDEPVRLPPFGSGQPARPARGGGGGGGGGRPPGGAPLPTGRTDFRLGGESPLIEAWKQRLDDATDRQERNRLMDIIRRLRLGQEAPAAPVFGPS